MFVDCFCFDPLILVQGSTQSPSTKTYRAHPGSPDPIECR